MSEAEIKKLLVIVILLIHSGSPQKQGVFRLTDAAQKGPYNGNTYKEINSKAGRMCDSMCLCAYIINYVFVIARETGRQTEGQNKSKEVTEFEMRTKAIMLQHPYFFRTVISALLFHPTLDWARQLRKALQLLRIRRERGIQEGHLRGIDA